MNKTKRNKTKNVPAIPGHEHVEKEMPFNLDDKIAWSELERCIIRVSESIDEYSTSEIMQKIEYIRAKGAKSISFMITSPGGSAYHSLALYDRISYLPKQGVKTVAVVEGYAASAAAMLLLQAAQLRMATANSRFLLHEPRRWVMFASERASDMKDESTEMSNLTDVIYGILSKRCNKSKKDIADTINRKEVWMSTKQALKFNLIDEIVK